MRRGRWLVSLTERIERLDRLREALAGVRADGQSATAALESDPPRELLVKIDRGLRTLRQGG